MDADVVGYLAMVAMGDLGSVGEGYEYVHGHPMLIEAVSG